MKKAYLVLLSVSVAVLAGCNPSDTNSDRGTYGSTNGIGETMGTNLPSAVSTNMPSAATNTPPASGTTNQ